MPSCAVLCCVLCGALLCCAVLFCVLYSPTVLSFVPDSVLCLSFTRLINLQLLIFLTSCSLFSCQALYDRKFPVPIPYDSNRHCIVMSLVPGYPMSQVKSLRNSPDIYGKLMDLVCICRFGVVLVSIFHYRVVQIVQLADHGLIHCDFNEFNIMVSDEDEVRMMLSVTT